MNLDLSHYVRKGLTYSGYKIRLNLLIEAERQKAKPDLAQLNFLKLSKSRMERLDKNYRLKFFNRSTAENHKIEKLTWLVISEPWCGDSAQLLPIFNKITENCKFSDLKIVMRDESPQLMNQFLTRGKKAVPKLIVLNEYSEVLFTWGSRPKEAQAIVDRDTRIHKKLSKNGQIMLQNWYNEDKGLSTENELIEKFRLHLPKNFSCDLIS